MLLLTNHLVHCARIRHADLHEETLTLLYSSPVKRVHLRNHAAGHHAELLKSLHVAINASWQEYSFDRSAGSFQLNDDFFDFQRDEYGETQPERGWLATEAGGRLLSVITSVAEDYLKELQVDVPALRAGDFHVWASVHPSCSIHPTHVHPGATLSGVLYVATEPDDGQIVFTDPRGTLPPFDDHRLGFRPAPGDILIFPPWLPHEVTSSGRCGSATASADSRPRTSISFNLLADRSYEQQQRGRSTAQYSHPVRSGEVLSCSDHISRTPQSSAVPSGALADKGTQSTVEDFVRRLEGSLTESLTQGEASHAKLCLRILAELANANVVPIEDLLSALQELLGAAADAEDRNGLQLCCHSMCDTKEKQSTL